MTNQKKILTIDINSQYKIKEKSFKQLYNYHFNSFSKSADKKLYDVPILTFNFT